jgi:FixJ family two-component response regulator
MNTSIDMFTTPDSVCARPSRSPDLTPMVFIVDDDPLMRESLELLIDAQGWRAYTFGRAHEFLAQAPAPGPSCLILDVALRDADGLELQQRLAVDCPQLPVIFVTGQGDVLTSVRAIKAGAVDFLIRPVRDETVLSAVREALERSRALLARQAHTGIVRTSYASLTPREREVMVLVASGLLNKQVGGELGISEITVKAHRGQVMRKMKADSLPALVHMVATLGIGIALRA